MPFEDLADDELHCPACGGTLDAEPVLVDHALRVAFTCRAHGMSLIA